MSKRVLLAYGTRYGSSIDIAEEIANVLKEKDVEVVPINLSEVKKSKWPSPDQYDGVIVGSGIKIGRWTSSAKNFLKINSDKFKGEEGLPLGVFVSSATAIENQEEARQKYIEEVMEKFELEPDVYQAFPGVLDFSEDSKVGFLSRKMLKFAAKAMIDEGTEVDTEARNDYRDWDEVREFAGKFMETI